MIGTAKIQMGPGDAPPLAGPKAAALADLAEAGAYVDFFDAAPAALRSRLGLRVERIADATVLLAPGVGTAILNRAIGLGLSQEPGADELDRVIDRLKQAGSPRMLHWSEFSRYPAEALTGKGLVPGRSWAKMLRGTDAMPPIRSELKVELAASAQVADVARVFAEAFEMPAFMADWLAALHGRPGWWMYAVTEGRTVVGCGCLYLAGEFAWLGMGAIASSHRRRGGQRTLMARRVADAIAAGARYIFTETGEPSGGAVNPSLNNMLRCGFVKVTSRSNFIVPTPA
jgi:hypothetical protein